MPWEDSQDYIRSGHRSSDDFEKGSFRTITISAEEGIKAVIGKPKGKDTTEVQSYLFAKDKDWTVDKAKAWFEEHKSETLRKHGLFFDLKFLTEEADPESRIFPWSMPARYYIKPGRMLIYGTALTAGQTRKGDVFSPEELRRGARSLISGPIELFEHTWDVGENRWLPFPDNTVLDAEEVDGKLEYIAGVKEPTVQQLIRKGVIDQVSVNAICRHVPADDPGQCNGMILNGFCLVPKDSVAASPGTYVKIWNCLRAYAHRLEGDKPPESEVKNMTENENGKSTSQVPSQKTEQEIAGHGPVAGVPEPSIEDRVKTLEIDLKSFQERVYNEFTAVNAKLDTLIQTTPKGGTIVAAPATASVPKTEQAGEPGVSPPKPNEEPPKAGEPKTDKERFMAHYNLTEEQINQVLQWVGEDIYKLLPERGQKTQGPKAKAETVIAAVKPVEHEEHLVVLTEQEILGVLSDKRRFTPALQLNGILDLLEAKKREAD